MKQAASIKDLELGGLLPGIKVNTVGDRLRPDLAVQLIRVQGRTWERSAKSSAATSAASSHSET